MPFVDTTFSTISKRTKKTEEKKSEVKVPEKILLTHLRAVLRQFRQGTLRRLNGRERCVWFGY